MRSPLGSLLIVLLIYKMEAIDLRILLGSRLIKLANLGYLDP